MPDYAYRLLKVTRDDSRCVYVSDGKGISELFFNHPGILTNGQFDLTVKKQ